ncbi:hypothetical protein LMH73_028070 [Vibrio splendidus]|nr:hypothetical protein [Vibrio splendidus]MCC4882478.1 hypothetical protein [Vibrio splendidus]
MDQIQVARELSLIANECENRKPITLPDAINWVRVELPSRIDHMLAIGYGIHYTDECNQEKFLTILDKDAVYRSAAIPLIEAAKQEADSKTAQALKECFSVERDINSNLAIMFWAIYLSEQNNQSKILRELEREIK